jgi:hypothetical protein
MKWSYSGIRDSHRKCSLFNCINRLKTTSKHPAPPAYLAGVCLRTLQFLVVRDSSVGIATRYELDGRGVESRWEWDFPYPYRPALGPTQPPIQYRVFPRSKVAGEWRWPPTPSSAEVKEKVQLYLYSPSGPSWPVLVWTLPFTFYVYPPISEAAFRISECFQYCYNQIGLKCDCDLDN